VDLEIKNHIFELSSILMQIDTKLAIEQTITNQELKSTINQCQLIIEKIIKLGGDK
jgi:hypothetical protein